MISEKLIILLVSSSSFISLLIIFILNEVLSLQYEKGIPEQEFGFNKMNKLGKFGFVNLIWYVQLVLFLKVYGEYNFIFICLFFEIIFSQTI